MDEIIKQIAQKIVEENRYDKIKEMESLAKKCKKCFHYIFRDPSEIKWDHTFVLTGHVCSYDPLCDPGVYELAHPEIFSVKEFVEKDKDELPKIRYFVPDGKGNLREVDFYEYWARHSRERTIDERIKLGECEFESIPPRSKPWYERDDEWDSKYKEIYLRPLIPRIKQLNIFNETELQELIKEELDFKNTVYYNER